MIRASELQETEANLYLAQAYDKGLNGSMFVVFFKFIYKNLFDYCREQNWNEAAKYYDKYIYIRENESNNVDEDSETNEQKIN